MPQICGKEYIKVREGPDEQSKNQWWEQEGFLGIQKK